MAWTLASWAQSESARHTLTHEWRETLSITQDETHYIGPAADALGDATDDPGAEIIAFRVLNRTAGATVLVGRIPSDVEGAGVELATLEANEEEVREGNYRSLAIRAEGANATAVEVVLTLSRKANTDILAYS